MRLSTPCSRRKVMLKASAVNVVDITAIPAIPGTITFRSFWLPENTAPNRPRRISGNRKLKKAALGLRQNRRRSRRYWRQVRAASSFIGGGQLQGDVLQRGPGDREVPQPLAAGQRLRGQLVQQRGGVVGLALHQRAVAVAVRHAVALGAAHAQLPGRPLG